MRTSRALLRFGVGYLLLLPSCSIVALFILYPILQAILYSLTDKNLLEPASAVIGLENYFKLSQDPRFWNALRHSLLLALVVVPLEFVLGLGFAHLLNQRFRLIPSLRKLALASWVIPIASEVMLFRWIFAPHEGIINLSLQRLGIETQSLTWFGDPSVALGMIGLMHLWRNVPFFGITLLAAMQSIPRELYDAARVDGAGPWRCLVHITLPQLRRITMVLVLGHVAFTFNEYEFVAIATGGGPVNATEVLPTYLAYQAWQRFDLGYASAIGTVMLVLFLCFAMLYVYRQGRAEEGRHT